MGTGMLASWGAPCTSEPEGGVLSSRVCRQVVALNLVVQFKSIHSLVGMFRKELLGTGELFALHVVSICTCCLYQSSPAGPQWCVSVLR